VVEDPQPAKLNVNTVTVTEIDWYYRYIFEDCALSFCNDSNV